MIFKKNPEVVAAVDLGSNSFHMIVARVQQGQLQVIDTIKEMVKLGSGITADHRIDEPTTARAIACLRRFGQRLGDMHPNHVRVVGTNALRRATRCDDFLQAAEVALGYPIEVISGMEEARLIYNGISHCLPTQDGKTLVVDIGGGSTEVIIGEGYSPIVMESLYMGCLALSLRFFADGNITAKGFKRAGLFALRELEPIAGRYRDIGWQQAIGSSGSVRSILEYIKYLQLPAESITLEALQRVRDTLITAGHVSRVEGIALPAERGPVFPGGLAILLAVFEALQIKRMIPSECALREGILHELTGARGNQDVRERTLAGFSKRYQIDVAHASRVNECSVRLYEQVADAWELRRSYLARILGWAAQLHETGLTISHSRYQLHGAYLVEHSDLPGFNRQEQAEIAAVIRLHRRKLRPEYLQPFAESRRALLLRLTLLLRVAVILLRSRSSRPLPDIALTAAAQQLSMTFPPKWLKQHPLTKADLEEEALYWQSIGYTLQFGKRKKNHSE